MQRNIFQIFAGGFAMCMILKQSVVVFTTNGEQKNSILLLSWFVYILLQLVKVWSEMEGVAIPNAKYLLYSSTFLYNLSVVGILFSGTERFLAIKNTSPFYNRIKVASYWICAILLITRTVRTILIFVSDSGGNVFPEASYIQLFTIFPIYTIIIAFDFLSVKELWIIFQKAKLDNKHHRVFGFYRIGLSLIIEIILAVVSTVVAGLEAGSYQGNIPSFIDWWLISWITGSIIDQKYIIRDILKKDTLYVTSNRKEGDESSPRKKQSARYNE
jgi:hypothetical protein